MTGRFCTASGTLCIVSSPALAVQISYFPLALAAWLTSRGVLLRSTCFGDTRELKGPLNGRLVRRNRRSFSAGVSLAVGAFMTRDTTAGTADLRARILADMS